MRKLFITMLAATLLCTIGQDARAEVPYLMPVVGVITTTDDTPIEGDRSVVFTLYTAQIGGAVLGGDTQDVQFEDGLFRAYLDISGPMFQHFIDHEEVWLGMKIGADSEMSRVRLASVPWAFEAETCREVTDLAEAGIQPSIGSSACGPNQAMRGWSGVAAVCIDLPDTSSFVQTSQIGTTVQAPISQTSFPCNYGIRQIATDGTVVCANQDVVTQCGVDAGGNENSYLGSDGLCHPAPHQCTANQYLSGAGTCQEAPHKCLATQYLAGDGACRESHHKCAPGQYLDGSGNCVAMAMSGTANRLAMFTGGTSVGDSIITQSGTSGVSVAGTATVSGVTTVNNYLVATGGVRVGSASNPGANNLSVAGNAQVTGRLGIGVAPQADLHVAGDVRMLADPASRNVNTIYTEGTDGFLMVTCNAGSEQACIVHIYADTNANPATVRSTLLYAAPVYNTTTIPIRHNWNWRTHNMGTGTVTIRWMGMGL